MANETIRQRTHNGVDRVMDKAASMKESGREKMAYLKGKAVKMKENTESYIRKNPKKSVLIAAGIGAVAGTVIAATTMRRKN